MSDSLQPHGLQHARHPCPSPTPGVYSNSCPSSRWCHPTFSSSVICFSFLLQSFPASVSFQMSQFFASGVQSIGVSVSISVFPMIFQDWFPLGGTGCSPRDSQESSTTPQFKSITSSVLSFLYSPTHIHIWLLENHSLDYMDYMSCWQSKSLLFNMLSRLVIAFLPRSKHLLISWLQSPSAVIL